MNINVKLKPVPCKKKESYKQEKPLEDKEIIAELRAGLISGEIDYDIAGHSLHVTSYKMRYKNTDYLSYFSNLVKWSDAEFYIVLPDIEFEFDGTRPPTKSDILEIIMETLISDRKGDLTDEAEKLFNKLFEVV